MIIDEESVLEITRSNSIDDAEQIAQTFVELLQVEFGSRHHARPRVLKKIAEIIDSMSGE